MLISFLLFKKGNENKANAILGLLVILMGVACLAHSVNSLDFYLEYPHLIRLDWGLPLLFGPLIFWYTGELTQSSRPFKPWTHFLPYAINLLILSPFFLQSGEEKILILDYFTASVTGGTDRYSSYGLILRFLISMVNLTYAILAMRLLKGYVKKLGQEYSNLDDKRLVWLKDLLFAFLILSLTFLFFSFLTIRDTYQLLDYDQFYFLASFGLIYLLSYFAISKPSVILIPVSSKTKATEPSSEKRTQESVHQLEVLMKTEEPYLKSDLTATELADMLSISRQHLSLVFSQGLETNFYDYINSIRVQEFKSKLTNKENDHLTILGIAYDSGFSSKTTFNTVFKKLEGMTPSEYKKSMDKSE